VNRLADLFPNSCHGTEVGLDRSLDQEVWDYACRCGFLIVTKDIDFTEFIVLQGFPPKVIWIRRGNCSTKDIETILRDNYNFIKAMNEDADTGILELF
jgi:predicted nuclease of predicted toxin-antitoxin system